MTITFNNGQVIQALSACIKEDSLLISCEEADPGLYEIFNVKSIMPDRSIPYKDRPKAPTPLQSQLIEYLQSRYSYEWNKQKSVSAAGGVLERKSDGDFWFFGFDGELMHNPNGIRIDVQ